ncbi:uncharacterized protein LOC132040952 [Lycium ferocissimum]|uniref:uncharacterized protein LOC132040952 n=1 Tax=Lycium ferocissimum TaxID=112874 RepID=UPI0028168425|nr:uncharacterized protein LOC132040952 [Lycium ferocissimum]
MEQFSDCARISLLLEDDISICTERERERERERVELATHEIWTIYQSALLSFSDQDFYQEEPGSSSVLRTSYGDTLEFGEFQIDGRSARGGQHSANDVAAEALNSGDAAAALAIFREKLPKDYIMQYHNIKNNLDRIFQKPPEDYVSPFPLSSFNSVPQELSDWVNQNVKDSAARPWRPISIVIEGDSRTGKTMWARSLGPHNYLCGHLDLSPKIYSNGAWYNVIDDVDPHYLKHFKEFMGAQRDWQSNTKYGKPIQIKGGIPTIFLCNPGPRASYESYLDEDNNLALKAWALKNAIFHFLDSPLYSPSPNEELHLSPG